MNLGFYSIISSSIGRQEQWGTGYRKVFWHFALYLLPSSILVLSGLLLFGSAGRDDAHITYWPAYTLSHLGQIVNYNGERVEQSSSLLQVVLLAALTKITGFELTILGKIFSLAFGVASLVSIPRLAIKIADRTVGFSATMLTAVFPYFVYWSYGGLESTLVALTGSLLVVTIAGYLDERVHPSVLGPAFMMILFELARPEAPLLLGCLLGSAMVIVVLKQRFTDKFRAGVLLLRLCRLFGIYVFSACTIFAFRLWYFGSLFPQPVSAKSNGLSWVTLIDGIRYIKGLVWGSDWAITVLVVAMATGGFVLLLSQLRAREINLYIIFSLLYVAGSLSFVVIAGGDWMEGGRFLVHLLPIALIFIPLALVNTTKSRFLLALFTLLLMGIEVRSMVTFAQSSSTGVPLGRQTQIERGYDTSEYSWFEKHSRVNMRDVPVIQYLDRLITQVATHRRPLVIMSGQMGIIPYHITMKHFGEVRFIDRYGLIDRTFTNCSLSQQLRKTASGLKISYDFYFDRLAWLEQNCRFPKPDIIYDVEATHDEKLFIANGYTILYSQDGNVTSDETWLQGVVVKATELIAIRVDLLSSLEKLKPVFVQFTH